MQYSCKLLSGGNVLGYYAFRVAKQRTENQVELRAPSETPWTKLNTVHQVEHRAPGETPDSLFATLF